MKTALEAVGQKLCSDHRECLRNYRLSVRLLEHQAAKLPIDQTTYELWMSLPTNNKDLIAAAILSFEDRKFSDQCIDCDLCVETSHLGMILKEGFVSASNNRDLPFETFGPQAFAILKNLLVSIRIVPMEKRSFTRFCTKAAEKRKNGKLRPSTALVWKTISSDCDHCLVSYQNLMVKSCDKAKRENALACYADSSGTYGEER